ncbi:hypothetical protein AOLI_G00206920 [Acnodon oligacanthus]
MQLRKRSENHCWSKIGKLIMPNMESASGESPALPEKEPISSLVMSSKVQHPVQTDSFLWLETAPLLQVLEENMLKGLVEVTQCFVEKAKAGL